MTFKKQAFTLIELSVVIVIVAIMLSTVLVSRSLITGAKVNKIQEEFRMFNGAFQMFYNTYDCYPGDCQASYITDLAGTSAAASPYYNFLNATNGFCMTGVATANPAFSVLNTGMIESPTKRTCMMIELEAAGYLTNLNLNNILGAGVNTAAIFPSSQVALSASKPNVNLPLAKVSKQAVWDFRFITGGAVLGTPTALQAMYTTPTILGMNGGPFAFWAGYHVLTLHDANISQTNTGTSGTVAYTYIGNDIAYTTIPTTTALPGSFATYIFPSNVALRLDKKFDDGFPYSGNIAGLRNVVDAQLNVPVNPTVTTPGYACSNYIGIENTIISTPIIAATNTVPVYQGTNSVQNGCIIAFMI